jgi:transposase
MALFTRAFWQMEFSLHSLCPLGKSRGMADDFQYPGGFCRDWVADAWFNDCQSPSARCRGKKTHGPQALGRSRGGFTTKIHALCDRLGYPIKFILTGGQEADCTQAIPLLEGFSAEAILADKGYDSNAIVEFVEKIGAKVVIPPKKNRLVQRDYDKILYKERNRVERLFNKLKHFRRVATRYDKLDVTFLAFVYLASTFILLK